MNKDVLVNERAFLLKNTFNLLIYSFLSIISKMTERFIYKAVIKLFM